MGRCVGSDFFSFLISVRDQWREILTGSITLALIGLVGGAGWIKVPGFVYWIVICLTLFWAFFGAWRTEHHARLKAESELLSPAEEAILQRLRRLLESYLGLVLRFPNSEAVCSPFNMTWRPTAGTLDIPSHVEQMIAWHRECVSCLDKLAGVIGQQEASELPLVQAAAFGFGKAGPPSTWEVLIGLFEIEGRLLSKVIQGEEL